MKIIIRGTGGPIVYIGGRLAHVGQDATFIARGENLQALREHGLSVKRTDGDFRKKIFV
jgi:2-dehydropantoate 2-reductase